MGLLPSSLFQAHSMNHRRTQMIVLVGILAIGAWAGVGYFAWTIQDSMGSFASRVATARQDFLQAESQVHTHLLVESSAHVRDQLTSALKIDFEHIVDTIESTGAASGAAVHIVDVVPETPVTDPASQTQVTTIHFLVSADGSFSALMKAATLLETLPMPSNIESIDLSRSGSDTSNKTVWHMGVRLRVVTSAHIAS